ncbi:class I SAM-dependent methyltransferase [Paenibacillus sp. J5C_2022]|uniref:class I SAM-dependent methyltransferase n=1 Tax=Paenibacillus sp. J5C2022 TaxID=2977129 RepID=UPI0021D04D41|nr:class I SAM-dependent methyltransferase [Paenibacillus sp. J5C2022]MCU6711652.1 class I SAM-dependent methyltransferase [Paenibacillus sp. J5C2022]
MSNHYYSKSQDAAHERKTHQTTLRGKMFKFVTDSGVFSKTGVDFGSRVLIEAMEFPRTSEVLDVGCGYGPIGLAAATLADQGRVTMIDINERAVQLATENAVVNGMQNVDVRQSDVYEAVRGMEFDVILTNPPIRAGKATVHRIFEEGCGLLRDGGSMWVVIQKKQGAPSAKEKLEQLFGDVEEVTKEKGYRIFRATK